MIVQNQRKVLFSFDLHFLFFLFHFCLIKSGAKIKSKPMLPPALIPACKSCKGVSKMPGQASSLY